MPLLPTVPRQLIFFWLIQFGGLTVIWPFLTSSAAAMMVALIIASGVLIYRGQTDIATILNAAFFLAVANFWIGSWFISPLYSTTLVFIGITLTGMVADSLKSPESGTANFSKHFLLGFITAQISSLIAFWPIIFIHKTALGLTFFFLFFQIIRYWQEDSLKIAGGHLVFTGLTVIVIVGSILWIGDRSLGSF